MISTSFHRRRRTSNVGRFTGEALEDRRVLASLNAQYVVELQTHEVALGFDHLSILITPANPGLYNDADGDSRADQDPLFVLRGDGSFALSLGAGPDSGITSLDSNFNRPNDIAVHPAGERFALTKPSLYPDSRAWVNTLISRSAGFTDGMTYSFFPETIGGHNSNSFIAGLLNVTGTTVANPSTIFAGGDYPGYATPVPAANFGTQPAQRLDLVFVVDTTGSMFDDIDAVKSAATSIVNTLHENFRVDNVPDIRVAVSDYRDFPVSPYGGSGDYPFSDVMDFRTSPPAIVAGIQSLSLGFGGDFPESVNSGLMHAITSPSLGSWRGEGVSKMVIVMGDAPGHNPEPFTGFTTADVIEAAINEDPVVIYPVAIGGSVPGFAELAQGTAGKMFTTFSPSQIVDAIMAAIGAISNAPVADAGGPYSGETGVPIQYNASNSFDPDGTIIKYEWDWESDGNYDLTTTTPFAQHTFTSGFTGRTRVRVTDNSGATNFDWAEVTVVANDPLDELLAKISTISSRFATALRRPLDTMIENLEQNQTAAAAKQLANFIKLVNAYEVRSILSEDLAAEMIELAEQVFHEMSMSETLV